MDDDKLKDIALNFQAGINNELLRVNEKLKQKIEALQMQLKESPEDFNKDSAPESILNTDLISRQEIIDRCEKVIKHGVKDRDGRHSICAEMLLDFVKQLPSVQPQTVGKWIKTRIRISSGDFTRGVKCSKCGYETIVDDFKYCPNCGNPKMEGSGENDSGTSNQNSQA